MFSYMYQYRGEIERIVENIDRDSAWRYVKGLYNSGLISLPEYQRLSEYTQECNK